MTLALVGFSIRGDLLGVTSFVRACFLGDTKYRRLLHFFHSPALPLQKLTALWVQLAFRWFSPVTFGGYALLIADGLKVPKEGKKMPAVKSLPQESENDSKAAFIWAIPCRRSDGSCTGRSARSFTCPWPDQPFQGADFQANRLI
jgi:hypothetical protein